MLTIRWPFFIVKMQLSFLKELKIVLNFKNRVRKSQKKLLVNGFTSTIDDFLNLWKKIYDCAIYWVIPPKQMFTQSFHRCILSSADVVIFWFPPRNTFSGLQLYFEISSSCIIYWKAKLMLFKFWMLFCHFQTSF